MLIFSIYSTLKLTNFNYFENISSTCGTKVWHIEHFWENSAEYIVDNGVHMIQGSQKNVWTLESLKPVVLKPFIRFLKHDKTCLANIGNLFWQNQAYRSQNTSDL